jgi:hypothetical protein
MRRFYFLSLSPFTTNGGRDLLHRIRGQLQIDLKLAMPQEKARFRGARPLAAG